jgi:regulator of RNase E activity RraA
MALYMARKSCVEQTGRRIGDRPYLLEASPIEAVDVNWPEDFEMANLIAAGMREQDRRLLQNIKGTLSSAMLSDILDDLGFAKQIIRTMKPNFDCRILGRAKTLKLRAMRPGEDFRGIYRALDSYKNIVPNDIIVVENEVGEYAYFGELNGNLAIRAGAVGAIVGGNTRDSSALRDLHFPVFAKGNSCQDVRKRAVLDHMNKAIEIDGVRVLPDELVFADFEGVVVIPGSIEKEVLQRCADVVRNEKQLILDISLGVAADELTEKYGFF